VGDELVARVREAVASRLEAELEAMAAGSGPPVELDDHRDLARDLIHAELDRQARLDLDSGGGGGLIGASQAEEDELARSVLDTLYGLGRLQALIDDPSIENININGADGVWVKRVGGAKERVAPVAADDDELVALIRHAATHLGPSERRFDTGSPMLDMRLPDGSRLSAVMGVATRPAISIRRHRFLNPAEASLDHLVSLGAIDRGLREFLAAAVRAHKTMVIAGGTNAGKTTLLRALANEIAPHERLVTIEKSLELGLDTFVDQHADCVALEAREANTEGQGAIGMSDLVRRGLRMDPDRVIVGEVLGDEIIDMLNAMSQGNEGSLCTIHANSSEGVFRRICAYAVQSPERLPAEATVLLIAGAVDFVIFIDQVDERNTGGGLRRFVGSIREVVGAEGTQVLSREVFRPASGADRRAVPGEAPACIDDLRREGYDSRLFRKLKGYWSAP
jgi:Flp pilus assembly CpaF family ATPase